MSRTSKWQEHLSEAVYDRLCMCSSTKKDMVELTRAYHNFDEKGQQRSKEDCLVYMLEWVLDWNGGTWDYTKEEYDNWLLMI